ncbi:F-box protein [Rhynchospora pubera]|uniref:F-box protein n=1 Tax=Rhynchospora pubera TaxID=906938 RepID=A0AAV8BWY3_9POAL|nr:F-box protein [Rhynchospora pubera]
MRQHRRLSSWSELWLKNVVVNMPPKTLTLDDGPTSSSSGDLTSLLSDQLLLLVFSFVPPPLLFSSASLVCRRWLRLSGHLRHRLTLLDWSFLHQRLPYHFPNLTELDLLPASFVCPSFSTALLSRGTVSVSLDLYVDPPVGDAQFISCESISVGLETIASNFPNLRKLCTVAPTVSDSGLFAIANSCPTLQELELHGCTDLALRPISVFENLQILRLVGSVEGLYSGPGVTDIGLTILAHGCKRLVELELSGCEGSYDGISAIGRCCVMLEELIISDHKMDSGWIAGLAFCGNLKTLRLQGCSRIDADPGPEDHLGSCPAVESVQLQRCQIRDKRSLHALFMVCESAREIVFQNCWGLDDELFASAAICRRVKLLNLQSCSVLSTQGLESIILSWPDLERLTVISCNNIKDEEISPALSGLFSSLKELKWRPDTKSMLATSLGGTGMGKKGGRFFKRRILPGQQRLKGKPDEEPS